MRGAGPPVWGPLVPLGMRSLSNIFSQLAVLPHPSISNGHKYVTHKVFFTKWEKTQCNPNIKNLLCEDIIVIINMYIEC